MSIDSLGIFGALIVLLFAAAPAHADLLHFAIDPGNSTMSVAVPEPMKSIRGNAVATFTIKRGQVWGDPDDPSIGSGTSIVIDAASFHSDSTWRDNSVRDGTLEVKKYPTIIFESTSLLEIVRTSHSEGSATLVGYLTLHGATRLIHMPVQVTLSDDGKQLFAQGEDTIVYRNFGIQPPSIMGLSAGEEAIVKFHIVANKSDSAK